MLTAQVATEIVLQNISAFGIEIIPISEATGRVLAEPLMADRDFPPFDRVTMDGIAVDYQAFTDGRRDFVIEGLQAAGAAQLSLQNKNNCLEVMTGAMLPRGTDTVVRYEDVIIERNIATIQIKDVIKGQNLHRKGSDRKQGALIVLPNKIITPAEIGVAATVGKAELFVKRLPRVAIIATGDEIVAVQEKPLEHQIRSSNVYVLQSLLKKWKIQAEKIHLIDNEKMIIKELSNCLHNFDVLLLSGGVSEGKLDFVPKALQALGVEQLLHKVQQRPGKPFWFGKMPGGATVFALPGNPVSALVCAVRYVEPWLQKSLHLEVATKFAMLEKEVIFKPNLTYFLQVKTYLNTQGQLLAKPIEGGGSGDLANLADADGFLELPIGQERFEKGAVFSYWQYR